VSRRDAVTDRTRIVVFVHGLWLSGHEGFWLGHRLDRQLGATHRRFTYRSVAASISESAAALGEYLAALRADTVDLVGHSMGGLVILKLFERPPALPAGRIVLLGPPLHGSRAAAGFARLPFGKALLGRGIAEAVLPAAAWPRAWSGAREVGVIAGRAAFGLGRLVARLDTPNDGVVAVEETRLAGARDEIVLEVQHAGMLFSRAVAAQTAAFLEHGRFLRPARSADSPHAAPSSRRSR